MKYSDDRSIKEKLLSVLMLKGDRLNRTDFCILALPLIITVCALLFLNEYTREYFWIIVEGEFESKAERSLVLDQYRFWRNTVKDISIPIYIVSGFYLISFVSKRLHDIGWSGHMTWIIILAVGFNIFKLLLGYFALVFAYAGITFPLFAIPFLVYASAVCGALLLPFLFFKPGQKGENKYGDYFEIFPNPLRKIIGNKIKFFR